MDYSPNTDKVVDITLIFGFFYLGQEFQDLFALGFRRYFRSMGWFAIVDYLAPIFCLLHFIFFAWYMSLAPAADESHM